MCMTAWVWATLKRKRKFERCLEWPCTSWSYLLQITILIILPCILSFIYLHRNNLGIDVTSTNFFYPSARSKDPRELTQVGRGSLCGRRKVHTNGKSGIPNDWSLSNKVKMRGCWTSWAILCYYRLHALNRKFHERIIMLPNQLMD